VNTQRLPDLIIATGVVGLAAWWWWPVPVKPVVYSHPAIQTPATSAPPSEASAVPAPLPVVAAVATPAPAAVDLQTELSTAIPDFIRLFQSGDFATLLQTYMPPEKLASMSDRERDEVIQRLENPQSQQDLQRLVWELQSVQSMTPVFNDTKTSATYSPPDGRRQLVFLNVNGRWYLD